jgi:hypothetical protein
MDVRVLPNSFCHFVYPFLFDPEKFSGHAEAIEQARWREIPVWMKDEFPREELLAHVARHLNPGGGTAPTVRLWRVTKQALLAPEGLHHRAIWRLQLPGGKAAIDFRIDDVQLAIFNTGVGFLTVGAQPLQQDLGVWLDFIHYFRFIDGQRDVSLDLRLRTGKNESVDIFPQLAEIAGDDPSERSFARIVDRLLAFIDEVEGRQNARREVFVAGQMMPYVGLLIDGLETEAIVEKLYRLQNFFHARQEIHPGTEDLRPDRHSLLSYAERQWFFFSLDGGGFMAANPPDTDFYRVTLPNHLRRHYFLSFLIVAHQRYALIRISEEVADQWQVESPTADAISAPSFERIRRRMLSFTARGYFLQVMQREHHHRCYRKWQEILGVERLYREVNDEAQEMHNYLLLKLAEEEAKRAEEERREAEIERGRAEQARRRVEKILACLGAFVVGPTLVLAYFSINVRGLTAADEGLDKKWAYGVIVLAIVSGLIVYQFVKWLISRMGESKENAEDAESNGIRGNDSFLPQPSAVPISSQTGNQGLIEDDKHKSIHH